MDSQKRYSFSSSEPRAYSLSSSSSRPGISVKGTNPGIWLMLRPWCVLREKGSAVDSVFEDGAEDSGREFGRGDGFNTNKASSEDVDFAGDGGLGIKSSTDEGCVGPPSPRGGYNEEAGA
jgi:hypothetical protein